ncbi:MAG: carbohydrate binding family 9 domain-containing protein [Taibaiella sp.]|nr:carbohydrate binding family 9 domain-containing protein [Taibaiella sp.]
MSKVRTLYLYCLLLVLCLGMCTRQVRAQSGKQLLNAAHFSGKITVDGKLTESEWRKASKAMNFVQSATHPGEPSVQRTAVSILYDDEAVYVGAMMYETYPDSIVKQLSPRDDFENSNTDAFAVTFDTYFDKQNATQFAVTAAGVQADAIVKFDAVDRSWNAAWFSRVAYTDSGWSVEMKIPYSALRFPKKPIQQWGVNFLRIIRRYRERSYWNKVDPAVQNVIGQSGIVDSIHDIKAPLRLALLPYLSAYAENYDGAGVQSLNGGMDIKYGVSESFTLDMTLIPDFGQTLFDNRVLNLSPIEVRYDERRYFFTEGVDLFNKNDLFYSRRVGGTPINANKLNSQLDSNEVLTRNPATSRLYNAAKFSGRTRKNTGIGLFNAVSATTNATVTDTTTNAERRIQSSPFTNYNVVVIDQALKNNSYISLMNTNVNRKEKSYNANVSALLFKFADKANRYGISGSADMSRLYLPAATDVGYRGMLNVGKQSGNYTWFLQAKAISDRFNPNDLGYLDRNNIVSYLYYNTYNTYKPFWHINTTYNKIGMEYYRAFNPNAFAKAAIHGNHTIIYKSFHASGAYWDAQPGHAHDYFEPRTPGRYFEYPRNFMTGGWISSDYRRKFAFDLEGSKRWFPESSRRNLSWMASPRYRFTDKLSAIYKLSRNFGKDEVGFVSNVNDSIYLGTRNLHTTVNTLTAAYIFTGTMSLKLDGRHYWSQAEYSKYGLLGKDGRLSATGYNTNHNINYNSFNVFVNFVWQFKPGSEMSIVYQNSIYATGTNLIQDYINDVQYTFQAPQSNSLSLKIIYFLDYQTMEHALHRKREG